MKIVNGYVCFTGCDEAVAKKGNDPRNQHADPVKAEQLAEADDPLRANRDDPTSPEALRDTAFGVEAVRFGGRLERLVRSTEVAIPPAARVDRLI